jgi:serine phosphatase RsbU (regulator of sigma subunit)
MTNPFDPAARIAALERMLNRQKAATRELEKLVEDRTRELYLAMERVTRQGRLVGARTAIALLAEYGSLEAAAPRMLPAFAEELGWQLANLWLVDTNSNVLYCATHWMSPLVTAERFRALTATSTFSRGAGLPGRVWASGTTAWVDDVVNDGNFPRCATARADGVHGGCAFPILVDGEVVAVIELFTTEVREPDDDLVHTFTALGSQIGQFIERARAQDQLRANELQIARRIQTAILPRELAVEGLEVASSMVPAADVGGDYYDVLPFPGGAWFGIGDVSGHGVGAGMIMIMIQSAVAALASPSRRPLDIVVELNRVLYDNIRRRMAGDDHATFTILRYTADGHVTFAGAHEELIVWRAHTSRCEQIETPGPWLGVRASIEHVTPETELQLEPGDVLVLYSDGITEARDPARVQFGIDRLIAEIEALADAPTVTICNAVIGRALRWSTPQQDDLSLVVARYVGSR